MNGDIHEKEVRLIDSEGEQMGVVPLAQAMAMSEEKGLDLVNISPKAVPPVCKIMDYGKFRFEQAKREKEAKKSQRIVEIKEIRFSPKIDVHDFEVKAKNANKFLDNGDKVKVTVRFRGREMAHTQIGYELHKKFAAVCSETSTVEKEPKLEGRQMVMFLAPIKKK